MGDYVKKYIFDLLGIDSLFFLLLEDMKNCILGIWYRVVLGKLELCLYFFVKVLEEDVVFDCFYSGGVGFWGIVWDYGSE